MTLNDLERALHPQFSWAKDARKKLQTSEIKYVSLGISVFIGLAAAFGFEKTDIMDYLAIEEEEYDNKLLKFQTTWAVIAERRTAGTLCQAVHRTGYYDYPDRLFLKTKLVLNALNSQGQNISQFRLLN